MKYLFKDVCPVINVPFREDESVNYKGIDRIVDFVVDSGCKSVCLFAFNSEHHKMTLEEKKEVITYFLRSVDGRIQTVIGLIDNSIKGVIELGLTAKEGHADGIILYPPSISCPAGEELIYYFKTVADAVDLPVMIQDNPRSTGINMSLDFIIDVYKRVPQFRYLKVECPFPTRKIRQVNKITNGEIKCYSGNGGIYTIDAHNCGAWGIMPGVAICDKFVEIYNNLYAGKEAEARTIFEKILPLVWFEDQSLEFYISCEKELLSRIGVMDNAFIRRPGTVLSEPEKKELFTLYDRVK